MRCWGTDEEVIIKILGNRTSYERQEIVEFYREEYKRELSSDLDGDLSGHFRDLAILLTETPIYLMAKSLYYAMKGVGTNESTIIEIIVGCNSEEIAQLKATYVHVLRDKRIKDPKRTLESDIRAETSGMFCKMLMNILKGTTPDPTPEQLKSISSQGPKAIVNKDSAIGEARKLFDCKGKPKGQMEKQFMDSFTDKNIWQLSAIAEEYQKLAQKSLLKAIEEQIDGDFGTLLIAMVEHASDRPRFFSQLLYHSMLGAGTHDFLLMRIMVLRSEIDLGNIKETYDAAYPTLESWIKGDTSGDYEKLLLTILGV